MTSRTILLIAIIAICLVDRATCQAQLAPEIGYVHPAGIQAGTTTEVTLGGYDWTPDMQLFSHDPRVTLELIGPPSQVLISEPPYWFGAKARGYAWPLPREFRARLTVPADVSPGFVRWQAANANGVSPVGVIHIGAVPEILEDAARHGPQFLPHLPVAVSGQIRRIEDVDQYRIRPTQTGPVTLELLARRLTSPANPMALHGIVRVHDDAGRCIVDVAATEGLDLATTFAVEANRDYVITLHDLDFAGDRSYVYRLLITPVPAVAAAFPAAGKRGETRTVEFVGWGVATGAAQLESISREVSFPSDPKATTFDYVLETPFGNTKPYSFLLSDFTELVEGAPFSEFPAAVTGKLDVRSGSDTYPVSLKKDDIWQIRAASCTTRLPLDLELRVLGPDGKELATTDDMPGSTDAELQFTVPADGTYQLVVTDRSGRSGDHAAGYRLSIERPQPDYTVNLPDLFSVPVGSSAKLPITVIRRNGFKSPITLTFEGLPEGMTLPASLLIAEEQKEINPELVCAADVRVTASLVRVTASSTLNGATEARAIKTLVVASIMKPRIKITPEGLDDVSKVRRGSTHLFPLLIDRLEGFDGPITMEMTAKQQRHRQGLASDEFVIEPLAKRVEYPIFVPEWMETTKTSRMILNGAVQVPDPKGNVRTLLQRMEMRLGILPEGALMKLAHHMGGDCQTKLGQAVTVPLTVSCASELRESIRIDVIPTEAQEGLISASTLNVVPNDANVAMTIHLSNDPKLIGEQSILIRATAYQHGKWLVKSETTVQLEIDR